MGEYSINCASDLTGFKIKNSENSITISDSSYLTLDTSKYNDWSQITVFDKRQPETYLVNSTYTTTTYTFDDKKTEEKTYPKYLSIFLKNKRKVKYRGINSLIINK